MANPDLSAEEVERSLVKPIKGQAWLDKKQRRAKQEAAEERVMRTAKLRDGNKCRFPNCEHMTKKPRIECAHVVRHLGTAASAVTRRSTARCNTS